MTYRKGIFENHVVFEFDLRGIHYDFVLADHWTPDIVPTTVFGHDDGPRCPPMRDGCSPTPLGPLSPNCDINTTWCSPADPTITDKINFVFCRDRSGVLRSVHAPYYEKYIRRMKTPIEWSSMPANVSIGTGAVHVWAWDYACSAHDLNRYIRLLSTDEHLRMQRFRLEKDRVQYGVSHAVLRILLGRYLGVQPSSIFFDQNEFGKPSLAQALMASGLTFNLSHTGGIGLLAVAVSLPIGVDIEEVCPVEYGTVERYFSPQEQASLATLAGADWLEGFYNCWTRKEAILKAEGRGLNVRLDAFDVSLNPNAKAAVLGVQSNAGFTSNWHLEELRPAHGFVGALATNAVPSSITCYTFAS